MLRAHVTLAVLLVALWATAIGARDYERFREIPCKLQHVLSIDNTHNTITIELDYREKVIPALAFALTSDAPSHFGFSAKLKDCPTPPHRSRDKTIHFGENVNATWHDNTFSVKAEGMSIHVKWAKDDTATIIYETTMHSAWFRSNNTPVGKWRSLPLVVDAERYGELTLYRPKFRTDRSTGCDVEVTVYNSTLWIPVALVPATTTTTTSTARTPSAGSVTLPAFSALLLLTQVFHQ